MTSEKRAGSHSLRDRLRAARHRTFVGRSGELELFRTALRGGAESFAVLFVTGPGGAGKSTLLRRFAEEASAAGRAVVELDGPPTAEAFEARSAAMFAGGGAVLLLDDFEAYEPIEDWLRERFLPRLPAGSLVVLAGRRPPGAMWLSDPGWQDVLRVVALGDLGREDAAALLAARGVPLVRHRALLAFAGGNPLALSLAAAVAGDRDDAEWTPTQDVVGALLTRLVGQVPSPVHRQALEVSAHVRATTEGLLRAVLPEADAGALFDWLRRLPFMVPATSGIRPHDVVREALEADLSWRDPQRYEEMHRRLVRHFVTAARTAADGAGFAHTEALMHMLWRGAGVFAGHDGHEIYEDVVRPGDRKLILDITVESTNDATADIVAFWLDRRPEAFAVYRTAGSDEPLGFVLSLRLTEPREEENTADPVVAEAWAHVRRTSPLREGEHLTISRTVPARGPFTAQVGDLAGARLLTDAIRSEGVAWTFLVLEDPERRRRLEVLGEEDPLPVPVGDATAGLFGRNWQETRIDTWLERLSPRRAPGPRRAPHRRDTGKYAVLPRPEFDAAVRGALRSWHRPAALAASPLVPTRLVADASAEPVGALRQVLYEAVERLRDDPREAKLHRAVTMTFLHHAPTQQAAADRLGLPFSTYRRHLTRGLQRVCDLLWQRELLGTGGAGTT